MSDLNTSPTAAPAVTEAVAGGLLEQVVSATKQTEPDRAQELVKTLVEQALLGTVTFDRNLPRTIDRAIAAIDAKLSSQLNEVMHNPRFLQLEGSWRGLNYLVMNSETGTSLKLRVLNLPKRELLRDLTRAVEFDQSQLFKQICEYEWDATHPDDVEALRLMSNVAAGAFAPFISAASGKSFGFKSWTELSRPRDLAKIFDTIEYAKWRSF